MSIFGSFDSKDPTYIKVAAIEADKRRQEDTLIWKNKRIHIKLFIKHLLYRMLGKKLSDFSILIKLGGLPDKDLVETIKYIKSLLEKLEAEDKSQEYRFAEDLSKHWILLLQLQSKRESPLEPLDIFINEVNHYPEGIDHSLGYYLTQVTGDKWLPFPFMEILNKLHEDARANKSQSQLGKWIYALNFLLTTL